MQETAKHPLRVLTALVGLVALVALAACGGSTKKSNNPLDNNGGGGGQVVVGSANFQENVLLGEIYAQALEAKGVKVQRKFNIGSREVIYDQVKSGGLTILPEYNGALLAFLDKTAKATSTAEVNAALKTKLPSGLEILNSAAAEDKDSISVTKETAQKYNLKAIPDLAPVAKNLVLGGPPEFKTRVQGVVGLKDTYGVVFKEFKPLDTAGPITVAALKKGDIQAANLFTTDPSVPANGFVVLQDPKSLFSAQNVTPLINTKGVSDKAKQALDGVSAKLDTSTLAELDKKVITDKQDVDTVAKQWLQSVGLT
jgi:osmoprotectant transport system substrate-binding protein